MLVLENLETIMQSNERIRAQSSGDNLSVMKCILKVDWHSDNSRLADVDCVQR